MTPAFWGGFVKEASARWRRYLDAAIASRDISKTKNIANAIFSTIGPIEESRGSTYIYDSLKNTGQAIHAPNPDFGLIRKSILETNKKVNMLREYDRKNPYKLELSTFRGKPGDWSALMKINPNKDVEIVHGGGMRYLKKFLGGMSPGYDLLEGGQGIQATPLLKKFWMRDHLAHGVATDVARGYATRAAQLRMDDPAILTGTIKARFLQPNRAGFLPPESAVGLRSSALKNLRNVKLTPVPMQTV